MSFEPHMPRPSPNPANHSAFDVCVSCGFGVSPLLQDAHLDGNRKNNAPENIARLCPTCHFCHDTGLLDTEVVLRGKQLVAERRAVPDAARLHDQLGWAWREGLAVVDWSLLHKGAQVRGGLKNKRKAAGRKAARTRKANLLIVAE